MADATSFNLKINLGPNANVQSLAGAFRDIGLVCRFASDLQRAADQNEAIYRVARDLPRYFDPDWMSHGGRRRFPLLWPDAYLGSEADALLRGWHDENQSELNAQIRVESASYSNPLELVIVASGIVTVAVLRMIRDWPTRQQANQIAVDEYRDRARARAEIRQIVIDRMRSGEYQLTQAQVEELLTPQVEDALQALVTNDVQIRDLRLDS